MLTGRLSSVLLTGLWTVYLPNAFRCRVGTRMGGKVGAKALFMKSELLNAESSEAIQIRSLSTPIPFLDCTLVEDTPSLIEALSIRSIALALTVPSGQEPSLNSDTSDWTPGIKLGAPVRCSIYQRMAGNTNNCDDLLVTFYLFGNGRENSMCGISVLQLQYHLRDFHFLYFSSCRFFLSSCCQMQLSFNSLPRHPHSLSAESAIYSRRLMSNLIRCSSSSSKSSCSSVLAPWITSRKLSGAPPIFAILSRNSVGFLSLSLYLVSGGPKPQSSSMTGSRLLG